MAQGLPPHVSGKVRCVQQHADLFEQCPIQVLRDAIHLRGVMHGKSARGSCVCKVFAEFIAQVLPAAIRTQDLNRSAMALGECPSLEPPIEGKRITLYREEVREGVAGRIVSECDEVSAPSMSCNSRWATNIGMDLITILLSLGTDLDLRHRFPSCACIEAHLTVLFP